VVGYISPPVRRTLFADGDEVSDHRFPVTGLLFALETLSKRFDYRLRFALSGQFRHFLDKTVCLFALNV
jgi:hypothetical protein